GQGFDSQTLTGQEGFGLIAMKQRAEKLGGQFQVSSRPGQGTEIIVNIFDQQTHKQQTHNQ
ncbi:MAG: ATP-binding protein, partial [Phormidesmis sp.]